MPRAPRKCGAKGCYNAMPCAAHKPVDRRPPGWTRYPKEHQDARAEWIPLVATGTVHCRRASNGTCLRPDDTLIHPGEEWHLGHPDLVCPAPRAPEHANPCNISTNLPGRRRGPTA